MSVNARNHLSFIGVNSFRQPSGLTCSFHCTALDRCPIWFQHDMQFTCFQWPSIEMPNRTQEWEIDEHEMIIFFLSFFFGIKLLLVQCVVTFYMMRFTIKRISSNSREWTKNTPITNIRCICRCDFVCSYRKFSLKDQGHNRTAHENCIILSREREKEEKKTKLVLSGTVSFHILFTSFMVCPFQSKWHAVL